MTESTRLETLAARVALYQEGVRDLRASLDALADQLEALENMAAMPMAQAADRSTSTNRRVDRAERRLDAGAARLEAVESKLDGVAAMLAEVLRRLPPAPG